MEKVSKIEKVALKAIAVGRFALMATFTGMFGFIALAGLLCFFKDYDLMNLLPIVGGTILARATWDMRRD
jgi:hypothetical protein